MQANTSMQCTCQDIQTDAQGPCVSFKLPWPAWPADQEHRLYTKGAGRPHTSSKDGKKKIFTNRQLGFFLLSWMLGYLAEQHH